MIAAIPQWAQPTWSAFVLTLLLGILLPLALYEFIGGCSILVILIVLFTQLAIAGSRFVRVAQNRLQDFNGVLVLSDELANFFRNGTREFAIRWSSVTRLLVDYRGNDRWQVRVSSRVASVDVVIEADKRTIAALRSEIKRRMGMTGTTGWGTRIQRRPLDE